MAQDWFRRQTWTASDAAEFETRLRRAHPASRPQYLRIQAVHLFETDRTTSVQAALSLADHVLTEYPSDMQVPLVRDLRAQCLEHLGDISGAINAYLQAVDDERQISSIKTDAYLRLGWIVATRRQIQYYDQALRLLDEFGERAVFPIQRLRLHAARAFIEDDRGCDSARAHAQAALAIVSERSSGFRYHQDLGLVDHVESTIAERLRRIAAG